MPVFKAFRFLGHSVSEPFGALLFFIDLKLVFIYDFKVLGQLMSNNVINIWAGGCGLEQLKTL